MKIARKTTHCWICQWGWVPFSGAIDELSKATDAELSILDEIASLKQEAAESEAGAAVLREAAALEATRAEQLRAGAQARGTAGRDGRTVKGGDSQSCRVVAQAQAQAIG
jgi:hypothetical protein